MANYWTCPTCNANLDFGEICRDCHPKGSVEGNWPERQLEKLRTAAYPKEPWADVKENRVETHAASY